MTVMCLKDDSTVRAASEPHGHAAYDAKREEEDGPKYSTTREGFDHSANLQIHTNSNTGWTIKIWQVKRAGTGIYEDLIVGSN